MPGTNIVYAEVGETSRNAFNVGANFRVRSDLSGAIGNQVERIASIEGSIGAAIETRRPLTMGGVFNLDDPNQAAAYTHLMTTSPFKLKANQAAEMANLAAVGVGFDYAATQKAAGMNATLTAGRKNLLAVRSVSRSERGTLHLSTTDGSGNITSQELSESEYAKTVTGKIPMLVLGKNGNVDVRATQVENADGTSSLGASMAMGIDVRKLSAANVARIRNLFTDLGVDTSSFKTDGAIGGKAHLDIEFAMDGSFFTNLSALGDKKELELQARFDANYQDLNGEPAPWNNTVAFDTGYPSVEIDTVANLFATSKAAIGSGGDEEMKRQARDSYNHSTRTAANPKGRSLDGDIKSFETRNRVAHAIGTASGGDAADWRPIMNAIGKTDQYDFMVIALMAHELGAPLVDFHVRGTGMDFSHSAPNVSARTPAIAEQVGLLTSRWNK